jgi:hypothetical protein
MRLLAMEMIHYTPKHQNSRKKCTKSTMKVEPLATSILVASVGNLSTWMTQSVSSTRTREKTWWCKDSSLSFRNLSLLLCTDMAKVHAQIAIKASL